MSRLRARRPTPAMVVALIALVIALGGTSYAAIKLPSNSVGTRQLKANAVTSSKIKDRSLKSTDLAAGVLSHGPKGDQGSPGAQGDPGAPGVRGPSDGFFVASAAPGGFPNNTGTAQYGPSLDLPDGSYLVFARATFTNNTDASSTPNCLVGALGVPPNGNGPSADSTRFTMQVGASQAVKLVGFVTLPTGAFNRNTVNFACAPFGAGTGTTDITGFELGAVRLETLHG
jgi:hypothetical protein